MKISQEFVHLWWWDDESGFEALPEGYAGRVVT
jgi:hypothetical protein